MALIFALISQVRDSKQSNTEDDNDNPDEDLELKSAQDWTKQAASEKTKVNKVTDCPIVCPWPEQPGK